MLLEKPTDGGLTDPTIGVRYTGFQPLQNWRLSLEGAAKIPVAGQRLLLSTGRADYGVQASLQRRGRNHAFYVDLAAVYYAGSSAPAPQDSQVIPTLVVGYEYKLTANTNVNLQAYVSESVYSSDQTDLDELTGMKYQYSLGHPPPSRQPDLHVRLHRERAEREQHARRRLAARLRLRAVCAAVNA